MHFFPLKKPGYDPVCKRIIKNNENNIDDKCEPEKCIAELSERSVLNNWCRKIDQPETGMQNNPEAGSFGN